MKTINKLVYAKAFRHEEINNFIKSTLEVYDNFLREDDRPVIESARNGDVGLSSHVCNLKAKYSVFVSTLDVPVKVIESDEIYELNKKRIKTVGDVKKAIKLQYDNTQSEESSILWNRVRIMKNLRKLTMDEISGHITNLIKELNTISMAPLCKTLKIEGLITRLTTEQNRFEALYTKRSLLIEKRVINSKPSKYECVDSYKELIDYSNSLVKIDTNTNYDTLVDELNAIINPMNDKMHSRKKKKDDRPVIESVDEMK